MEYMRYAFVNSPILHYQTLNFLLNETEMTVMKWNQYEIGPVARILSACCLKWFLIWVMQECETKMQAYSEQRGAFPEQQKNMTPSLLSE